MYTFTNKEIKENKVKSYKVITSIYHDTEKPSNIKYSVERRYNKKGLLTYEELDNKITKFYYDNNKLIGIKSKNKLDKTEQVEMYAHFENDREKITYKNGKMDTIYNKEDKTEIKYLYEDKNYIKRYFDKDDDIIKEEQIHDSVIIEETIYSYNKEKRISETKKINHKTHTEEIEKYTYNNDCSIIQLDKYINGEYIYKTIHDYTGKIRVITRGKYRSELEYYDNGLIKTFKYFKDNKIKIHEDYQYNFY